MPFKKGEFQWWQKIGVSRTSYAHRARKIVSRNLYRKLTHKEVIHHLDGDWTNNNLDNLHMFTSHKEHMIYHRKLIRWIRIELGINKTKKQYMDEWHPRNKDNQERKRILRRERLVNGEFICYVCKRKDFPNQRGLNMHLGRIHRIKIDPKIAQRDWYLKHRAKILSKYKTHRVNLDYDSSKHKGVKKND